jgi:hypothetical protein
VLQSGGGGCITDSRGEVPGERKPVIRDDDYYYDDDNNKAIMKEFNLK